MTRSTRRLVAAAATGLVVAVALVVAWGVISFLGLGWGVLVLVLAAVAVRFTPPWWVVLAPDDVTSWAALLPALWRWADRGPGDAGATPPSATADRPTSTIADRPAPPRW